MIAITDGPISPLKAHAKVCLELADDSSKPFRSLVAPLCLAQALVVSTGHQLAEQGAAKSQGQAGRQGRAQGGRMNRPLDLICVGRAAVDLYGEQIGGRLEDMQSFSKYLGGSPANTAVGVARLGLKPAMLTRVGDEHNGRFVRETLAAEGVDVSHVATDPQAPHRAGLPGHPGPRHLPAGVLPRQLRRHGDQPGRLRRGLHRLVQGAADFGHAPVAAAHVRSCTRAMALAKAAGTRVVLDIDYRPVLWGLTSPGMGEQRFVPSGEVSAHLQTIVGQCDLVVGTEEEIHIAGGSTDTLAALRRLRELTAGTLVVRRGPMGCVVFDGAIPDSLEKGLQGPGFPVDVYNVLGAGDAFMSGFLRGWIPGEPLTRCCAYANACGALVVSRHGCAPAMASWEELQFFLVHGSATRRLREDAQLEHLHRASTRTRALGRAGHPGVRPPHAAGRTGRAPRRAATNASRCSNP